MRMSLLKTEERSTGTSHSQLRATRNSALRLEELAIWRDVTGCWWVKGVHVGFCVPLSAGCDCATALVLVETSHGEKVCCWWHLAKVILTLHWQFLRDS